MKSLVALFAFIVTSCSHNVFVVDEAGNPIEGARVTRISRSFSWAPVETNKKGSVFVHQDVPRVEQLRVSKHGYRPHPPINFDLPKPITVVLKER